MKTIVNNPKWVILGHFSVVIIFGLIFSYIENKSIVDGLYWSWITVLTIGYGDVLPTFVITKIMSVFMGYFGLFSLSILISHILSLLIIDKDKFTNEEQYFQEEALVKIAEKLDIELKRPDKRI